MPKRLTHSVVATVATVLSLLVATGCTSSGKDDSNAKASTRASTGPVPKTAKNDTWSWTVSKVDYAPSLTDKKLGDVKPDESGTVFCMITTKIKNLTATSGRYTIHLADAFDASGKDYTAWGFLIGDGDLEAGFDIQANQEVPAVIVFEVPSGTTVTNIAVGDSFAGQAKIDLG